MTRGIRATIFRLSTPVLLLMFTLWSGYGMYISVVAREPFGFALTAAMFVVGADMTWQVSSGLFEWKDIEGDAS